MLTFRAVVHLFRGAYSSRKMAAPTPTGNAIKAVKEMTQTVPKRAEFSPARSGRRDGMSVIRCQLNQGMPRSSTVHSKIANARIETQVAHRKTQRMIDALVLRTATWREVRPRGWLAGTAVVWLTGRPPGSG